jgi:hypothetical protein
VPQHVRRHVGDVVGSHVAAVVEAGDGLRRREEVDAGPRARSRAPTLGSVRVTADDRPSRSPRPRRNGRSRRAPSRPPASSVGLDHRLDVLQGRRPDAAMPEAEDLPLLVLVRVAERELERKRSSWASGSGYVPSYSIGFCVARRGTARAAPAASPRSSPAAPPSPRAARPASWAASG